MTDHDHDAFPEYHSPIPGVERVAEETRQRLSLRSSDFDMLAEIGQNWRLTPATLAYKVSRGAWIPAPWLLYVSEIIAKAIARGDGRIIISAPPRHGKSQLIDIWTPVWVMENFPGYHTVTTSYGAELSMQFGRQARDIINQNQDVLRTKIRADARKVEHFICENGASMRSTGVGGPITGTGAHVLLVDDYIKDIKEALSPTYREYVWKWFTTTAYTRLEPGGTCIIIATRWHSDDLIGRVLREWPGKWTNIVLPAIAERGDILGRVPGQALFPERYPVPVLQERLEVLGSIYFHALFQQRPVDETKRLASADWINLVELYPDVSRLQMVRVWDLAATEGGGDYTVGALCGYDKRTGFFYVLNVLRGQWSPGQVENMVQKTAVMDGQQVKVLIEQEPGSAGKALIEHYRRTVLPEFTVEAIPTNSKTKVVRAQPLLAGAEAGKVFMVAAGWNKDFLGEFDEFPAGDHDDQVDTVSGAYTALTGRVAHGLTWGREDTERPGQPKDVREKGIIERRGEGVERKIGATWGRASRPNTP